MLVTSWLGGFKMHSEAQNKSLESEGISNNKKLLVCIFCKSQNVVKKGFRQTENRGKIQRYLCRDCKRSFCIDDGFYRMRNHEDKITQAIDLYFSNLSSRKVRNHFKRHLPKNASHVTILDWCRRYVLKVTKYVDTLQPQLSGQIYLDETEIDCEKRNDYFWASVDWGTRYIPVTSYTLTRGYDEAKKVLESIKRKKVPKYIQTDSAMFYPKAFNNVFGQGKRKYNLTTEHKIINTSKTGRYNVRIESVFMKIKDRVDDFRGLKALWSAPILLQGIILQHNYIKAHTTTNHVPSELAGLKLDMGLIGG